MKGDGVSLRELGEGQHHALVRILSRIQAEHRAELVVLVESCGRHLAVSAGGDAADLDALASLAASAVAASGGLAGLLGETGASLVLQRGDRDLIHLEPAGDLVVAVVFAATSPQGLEKVRARLRLKRALSEMQAVLAAREENAGLRGFEESEVDTLLDPLAGTAP